VKIELDLDDALMRRIAERTKPEVFWADPGLRRLIVTHLVHVGFEAKLAAERAGRLVAETPNNAGVGHAG
jgi:hypothetical protein